MEDLEYRLACKENTEIGDWIVVEGMTVANIKEVDDKAITAERGGTIHQQKIENSVVLRSNGTYTFGGGSIKEGDFLVIDSKGVSQIVDIDTLEYDNLIILHKTGYYSVGKNLL